MARPADTARDFPPKSWMALIAGLGTENSRASPRPRAEGIARHGGGPAAAGGPAVPLTRVAGGRPALGSAPERGAGTAGEAAPVRARGD